MYFNSIFQFPSGDKGYEDENGNMHLVGRIKETISLQNAKKVNSSLIEELMQKCDQIVEVAVKGLPNDRGFDDIHAFVYTT